MPLINNHHQKYNNHQNNQGHYLMIAIASFTGFRVTVAELLSLDLEKVREWRDPYGMN